MKKVSLIIVLIVSFSNAIFGCICYGIESFSLNRYDESVNIVEIEVLEKIKDDYEDRLAKFKVDTINWNKKHPPLPLLPPNNYTEFKIAIVEVFKGKINKSTIKLRANERNFSCYWEPKIGKNYIFYLGETTMIGKNETVEIFGCQRTIRFDSKNYETEKNSLKILKEKEHGRFKIDQSVLMKNPNKKYISMRGKFRNGRRHGRWIIAEPISYSKMETIPQEKVLVLRYKNGNVISVKYFEPKNEHIKYYFTRIWRNYYDEKKL